MQKTDRHLNSLGRTTAAKRELNELCRDLVVREIEKGRLKRPLSMRRLRRWVAKQVTRRVGLRGEGLRVRWRQAALATLLMSGMVLSFGTEAKAGATFVDQGVMSSITGTIDVAYGRSTPAFADIDADGDLDLFSGQYFGTIRYYVNDGGGVFTEQPGAWNPGTKAGNPLNSSIVDLVYYAIPAFADIDADGDLDVFLGEWYGSIKYYVNDGTGVFAEQTGVWNPGTKAGNPFNGVNNGYNSVLAYADIDADGDLDAFNGEWDGTINYFRNRSVEDGTTGVFLSQSGAWGVPSAGDGNPFNGVDVDDASAPEFADIDGDGDLDAFIGNLLGTIKYYVNDGSGGFAEQTGAWTPGTKAGNPFDLVDIGGLSDATFADIDGDGDLDAYIGRTDGMISYYKNMNTAPTFDGTPAISGTGVIGNVLSLLNTSASDLDTSPTDTVTLSYQWKADNVDIVALSTSETFTITATENGTGISCMVSAHDGWGGLVSAATGSVYVTPDTTPDVFTFVDQTGALLSTLVTSNTITVTGIDFATPISITVGAYQINSGSWTSSAGTVNNNGTVTVRQTSAPSVLTTTDATLDIGGVSDIFSVTTEATDTTPDAFTFTDQTGVLLSTLVTSNTITVTGINTASAISITGGEYRINSGSWTSSAGTVNNNDAVTVRQTSAPTVLTTTDATLDIGGVSDIFSVTTEATDTTPDAFTFTDQTGLPLSTLVISNTITVTGINTPTAISITGGEYQVNSGSWMSSAGTVNNNDTVTVRQTSASTVLTTTDATLDIGGVSDIFSVTTEGTDTTPDAFTFTDQNWGVPISTLLMSNTITVTGINTASAISITGGEYQINSGSWTSSAGTVNNNDTVTVRQTSSPSVSTMTDAVLTIGGVSDTFSVTTAATDTTPVNFSLAPQAGVPINTLVTSNTVTVTGIASAANIAVTRGEYQINSGPWMSSAGTVNNNDTVTVRQISSPSFSFTTDVVLTIGGVSDTFSVTTEVLLPGDVDSSGDVDAADALKALRITAGIETPSASERARGDVAPLVNNAPQPDGRITIGDVVVILRKAIGLW